MYAPPFGAMRRGTWKKIMPAGTAKRPTGRRPSTGTGPTLPRRFRRTALHPSGGMRRLIGTHWVRHAWAVQTGKKLAEKAVRSVRQGKIPLAFRSLCSYAADCFSRTVSFPAARYRQGLRVPRFWRKAGKKHEDHRCREEGPEGPRLHYDPGRGTFCRPHYHRGRGPHQRGAYGGRRGRQEVRQRSRCHDLPHDRGSPGTYL